MMQSKYYSMWYTRLSTYSEYILASQNSENSCLTSGSSNVAISILHISRDSVFFWLFLEYSTIERSISSKVCAFSKTLFYTNLRVHSVLSSRIILIIFKYIRVSSSYSRSCSNLLKNRSAFLNSKFSLKKEMPISIFLIKLTISLGYSMI